MRFKAALKICCGRSLKLELLEKLTEYSIWQQAAGFDLRAARHIKRPGKSWQEVVEGSRRQLWRNVVDSFGHCDVLLLELGVWQSAPIAFFAELISSRSSPSYGFDSFEDLPSHWRGMEASHFSTGGAAPEAADNRIPFVKGWFQNTLPAMMDEIVGDA